MSDHRSEEPLSAEEPAEEESTEPAGGRRKRAARRPFPATSFEEALFLARAIQTHGAGQPIRRLTLFEALDRSPDSGPTRRLITASGQYGITTGGYNAETLALTPLGNTASSPTAAAAAQLEAKAKLSILQVAPFYAIYDQYRGSRLPAIEVLRDAARTAGVPAELVAECVETFLANARDLSLIRSIGGSEHLVEIDAVIDEVASRSERPSGEAPSDRTMPDAPGHSPSRQRAEIVVSTETAADLSETCFVVSPIGDPDSVERKHADLVLAALIEPALAELGLVAVRADKISQPGLITGQVIEHVARAKLVIADLSFGNPNVYYELALRHATRKPIVQIIRHADRLPFDVGQFRTVTIDMTDIYTLVPQIDLHRQEITRQCRAAIAEGATSESPLSRFYPQFWSHIASQH